MPTKSALYEGFNTGFIDRNNNSNLAYRPEFVSNDPAEGKRVLSTIEKELSICDEFLISVAFITLGGITPLLQIFKELEQKGIPGKILTTDYLSFTDPAALDKLNALTNIELRIFDTANNDENSGNIGFHTKGYLFRKDEVYRMIIGSSNITASALKINREWNTKIVGYETGEVIGDVLNEFQSLWSDRRTKRYEDFIEEYRVRYKLIAEQKKIARTQTPVKFEQYRLQPNSMQVEFVNKVKKLVSDGQTKALLISATGTGKTYASAFAIREMHPKRVLFLVHREQIAKQAMKSYQNVFGERKVDGSKYTYELLTGNTSSKLEQIKKADLIFATMQTVSKDNVLSALDPKEFSCICLDEAHHTGAGSYQKIMAYFQPDFWLGMTASPDTNRFDVYKIFDHNIACEIRLQQALENNLLCPFHYFGITDIEIDGHEIGDSSEGDEDKSTYFNRLVSDDRVTHVIEQAQYYGHSGERVKGLIFCSRKEEAKTLSRKFNERGLKTAVLTGEDSEAVREETIDRLVGEGEDILDYIFTVDIFSEGVDIPEINQVIMLRPTQSAIVFVQQLGRGLRKSEDKEFVVILDFIGNYKNNFLIPIALSGDRSYNKDNVRRYVMEGDRVIPGISTIHFDEISRKRIFTAIDSANFNDIKLIKENYHNLKNKLGRIPALKDFDTYGEMDVCRIFDNKSLGSYYMFLKKYEKEYKVRLSSQEEKIIEFISKKLAAGKRVQELEMLKRLLHYQEGIMGVLQQSLESKYQISMDQHTRQSVINVMTNEFPSGGSKGTYEDCIFIEKQQAVKDEFVIAPNFAKMLRNSEFYRIVEELVDFGISRYQENYSNRYQNTNFVLYQKYTYEDACRLLNWESNEVPLNIGGYKFDQVTKTFPIFINYEKEDDISVTTKYEDHFTSESTLIAISKSKRTVESDDVQNFLYAKERGIAVHLFVRKNKEDKGSKEFYYLGGVSATGNYKQFVMPGTTTTAVEIEWQLDTPVREDIYEYIVNN